MMLVAEISQFVARTGTGSVLLEVVMTVALFSLLGVVLGGFLQYFFSRHLESQRAHREAR